MRIYGINPVVEAFKAKRVTAIHVSPRTDERLIGILRLAEAQGIPVRRPTADELNRLAGGARHHHQGVVADVPDTAALSVEDLVAGAAGAPLIVVLDQIEDPHNVGAILRTVDAAGADAEALQNQVYEVGKRHAFADLRAFFQALYEILLGQSQGPRFGGFVALYGVKETGALIKRALAGEDLSKD